MAEISDETLAQLQKGMALLQKLSTDPTTRRDFERVVKKAHPEVETSDDVAAEVAKPYVEKIEAMGNQLSEFLTSQQKRDQEAADARQLSEMDTAFGRLRSQGLQDEGVEHVKKLMIERNIADPEAAFALFERQNPKPATSAASWEPDSWGITENPVERDVKGLFESPDRWADVEVHNVLAEMRKVA